MNMWNFLLAIALSSVITSFSDWLFMGALLRNPRMASPEFWRETSAKGERSTVAYSQIIAVLSCGAFAYMCVRADSLSYQRAVGLAFFVWLAGPVVLLSQMVLWTKMPPLMGTSHAVGWLVRFVITGLLSAWLLSHPVFHGH